MLSSVCLRESKTTHKLNRIDHGAQEEQEDRPRLLGTPTSGPAEDRREASDRRTSNRKTADFKPKGQPQTIRETPSLTRQMKTAWRKEIEAEVAVELRNAYIGFEKQLYDLGKEEDFLAREFAALTNSSPPAIDNQMLKIIIEKPAETQTLIERDSSIAYLKKQYMEMKRELEESEEDLKLRERMVSEQNSLESINQELKHLEKARESRIKQIGSLEQKIEAFHSSTLGTGPTGGRLRAGRSDEQLLKTVITQENNEMIGDIKFNEEKLSRMEHLGLNLTESKKTLESALTSNDPHRNIIAYEQYFEYIVDQYEHFLNEVIEDEVEYSKNFEKRIQEKALAVETCSEGYFHIKQKELEEYRRGERSSFSPIRKFVPSDARDDEASNY